PMERAREVQKLGESWLKTYSGAHRTYEGQGVLFETAYAYLIDAQSEKEQKIAGPKFDRALELLKKLAAMDGDNSDRARQITLSIEFQRLDAKAEPTTFEQCILKA